MVELKERSIQENLGCLILGIDDAGRGPVIGPMVLSGCLMDKEVEKDLKEHGVMDSKVLTRQLREGLDKQIKKKVISYCSKKATPAEIDTGMGQGLNLNQVEAMLASIIIDNLTKDLTASEKQNLKIVIDCPSNNINGWKNQLMDYIKDKKLNISCEHKADVDHVAVSAASIISKVRRDNEIKKLREKIGIDFGSGYPNDPKTKDFLKKHVNDFKKERIFRETWSTWQEAKQNFKTRQAKLPDY